MYDILHVLHMSLYIPIMLYSWFLSDVFGFVQCCIVFVVLNSIFMLVCLKRLVSFLICGLWYVEAAHFLFSSLQAMARNNNFPEKLITNLQIEMQQKIHQKQDKFLNTTRNGGDRGGTVVKVLCYKSEGRWFNPRWCHWNFSLI